MVERDDRPLHIALVSPALPDSGTANGIVTYTGAMRDGLREAGHRVSVVTPDLWQDPVGQVHTMAPPTRAMHLRASIRRRLKLDATDGGYGGLQLGATIKAVHSRMPIDVVEMEESFGKLLDFPKRLPPVVLRLHGPYFLTREEYEPDSLRLTGDRRVVLEGKALQRAAGIISPTHQLLGKIEKKYAVSYSHTAVIPNPNKPIDQDAWSVETADLTQLLCVGRFDHCKGADIVAAAFEKAHAVRPDLHLVMVGPDIGLAQPDGTRVHFAEFARTRLAPTAASQITFLGTQPADEIERLRKRSGLTIIGSRYDSFPYSALEALDLGCPTIMSDAVGVREIIEESINGFVVSEGDATALAEKILAVVSDRKLLSRVGRQARESVRVRLSPVAVAEKSIIAFRDVAQR